MELQEVHPADAIVPLGAGQRREKTQGKAGGGGLKVHSTPAILAAQFLFQNAP